MERQGHGFEYHQKMCERHNLLSDENYTGMWDAHREDGISCIVKIFKENSELPLSDIFNNAARDKDFYLMYGVWRGKKSNIVEEKVIFIDIEKWKELFEWEHYEELNYWIKNLVSNSYSYDKTWKSEMKVWKERWGMDRLVQPRFKRDHKKQRRIQSAVAYKNLDIFLNYVKKK
jgi:hypothetical protein